jgi:hypothetical protein
MVMRWKILEFATSADDAAELVQRMMNSGEFDLTADETWKLLAEYIDILPENIQDDLMIYTSSAISGPDALFNLNAETHDAWLSIIEEHRQIISGDPELEKLMDCLSVMLSDGMNEAEVDHSASSVEGILADIEMSIEEQTSAETGRTLVKQCQGHISLKRAIKRFERDFLIFAA